MQQRYEMGLTLHVYRRIPGTACIIRPAPGLPGLYSAQLA